MTTELVRERSQRRARVEGVLRWAVLASLACGQTTHCVVTAVAQERPVHWLHAGAMPPGAIGSQRLVRGGPLYGYFQPVRIRASQGARIALAEEAGFGEARPDEALVGLHIGGVYRLHVTNIPNNPGVELYPTVEVVDRLYPPPGLALRYPIPIELTLDELDLAARGAFVTRVIYVEDPHQALPVPQPPDDQQPWIEAAAGEDPLVVADRRGRPVAILRMGGRVPTSAQLQAMFGPGVPPFVVFDPNAVCPVEETVSDQQHGE